MLAGCVAPGRSTMEDVQIIQWCANHTVMLVVHHQHIVSPVLPPSTPPLNGLQSPPSTPLHPTPPKSSPESPNPQISMYLPPVLPSIFPATIILCQHLQPINVFSSIPHRNYPLHPPSSSPTFIYLNSISIPAQR
jgi:hypothetical protein